MTELLNVTIYTLQYSTTSTARSTTQKQTEHAPGDHMLHTQTPPSGAFALIIMRGHDK